MENAQTGQPALQPCSNSSNEGGRLRSHLNVTGLKVKVVQSCRLFEIPWTTQSVEFSRPEYQNGQPFPSPGDLPNPGIEPRSPTLLADSLPAEPQGKQTINYQHYYKYPFLVYFFLDFISNSKYTHEYEFRVNSIVTAFEPLIPI